jgi:hypothetical protein
MLLERQQKGKVDDVFDLRSFNGQVGEGVYFHLYGNKAMRKYYQQNGEESCIVEIDDKYVLDLSSKRHDYWNAKWYIANNPNKCAFIFQHKGIGIPTSKQILVTDITKLKLKNV